MDPCNMLCTLCMQPPQLCACQPPPVCYLTNRCYQQRTCYGYYRTGASRECSCRKPRPRRQANKVSHRSECPEESMCSNEEILKRLKCIGKCWNVKLTRNIAANTQTTDKGTSTQTQETRMITADSLEELLPCDRRFIFDDDSCGEQECCPCSSTKNREEEKKKPQKEKESSKKKSGYCAKGSKSRSGSRKGRSRSGSREKKRLRGGTTSQERMKNSPYTQTSCQKISSSNNDVVLYFETSSLLSGSTAKMSPPSETVCNRQKGKENETQGKPSATFQTDPGSKKSQISSRSRSKSVEKCSEEKIKKEKEEQKKRCTIL